MKIIQISCFVFMFTCCLSSPDYVRSKEKPNWLRTPPSNNNYVYGLGIDKDKDIAKKKSLIDISLQISTQVSSTLYQSSKENKNEIITNILSIDKQCTDHQIFGSQFVDQYIDSDNNIWILSRAPINCTIDVLESMFLSYELDILEYGKDENILKKIEENLTSDNQYYIMEKDSDPFPTELRGRWFRPNYDSIFTFTGSTDIYECTEYSLIAYPVYVNTEKSYLIHINSDDNYAKYRWKFDGDTLILYLHYVRDSLTESKNDNSPFETIHLKKLPR